MPQQNNKKRSEFSRARGRSVRDRDLKLRFFYDLDGIGPERINCVHFFPFASRRAMADALGIGDARLEGSYDRLSQDTLKVLGDYFGFDPNWPEWLVGTAWEFAKRYNYDNWYLPRNSGIEKLIELEQYPQGAVFRVLDDQLVIAPSGRITDEEASRAPLVQAMHKEVQRKGQDFLPVLRRLDNQLGWGGVAPALERLLDYLDGDTLYVAAHVGEVWSSVVELGSFLELDQRLQASPSDNMSPLALEVRRQFIDFVRTAAPFVRQFPSARVLDDESGAFLSRNLALEAADEVVHQATNVALLSAKDRKLLEALIAAAERGDFQGIKASSRACSSAMNLVIASAALIATFYMGSIASYHSSISPIAKKAAEAIAAAEQPIIKLFSKSSPDIRLALQFLIERIKEDQRREQDAPSLPKVALPPPAEPSRRQGGPDLLK